AALVASNHNPPLRAFAKRLKDKGTPHKLVLIAVARKLIIIANALLAQNTVWKAA
ncbi:MAG: IS110 family transposase, partial [Proteobacteria bacterium]|nr:IS110 family transposase [Pseudomonadota bacterium]